MQNSASEIEKKAKLEEKANKGLIKSLKKKHPRNLDEIFQTAHEYVFQKTDCLACANCCKTLGPRLSNPDIERLAKYLKIKTVSFISNYLRVDEDGDYVFKQMPCPFLEPDNKCQVYEQRPKACRDYPHTDRKKMQQILDLTLKNSYVCLAVTDILVMIRKSNGHGI